MPARELITYDRTVPGWPWRLAVLSGALAMTALTALLIPLADLLAPVPRHDLEYRTVELSDWRPPPPPPPVSPPKPREAARQPPRPAPAPVPRPSEPVPPRPERPRLPIRLDLALSEIHTDLSLDFEFDPSAASLPGTVEAPPAAEPPPAAPAPAPPPAGPAELRDLDRPPAVLTQTRPVYPYRARTQRLQGFVDVQFTVTPEGRVEDAVVLHAEPRYVFDDAALTAVRRWTFTPGIRGGRPVAARMQIRIRFTLEEP